MEQEEKTYLVIYRADTGCGDSIGCGIRTDILVNTLEEVNGEIERMIPTLERAIDNTRIEEVEVIEVANNIGFDLEGYRSRDRELQRANLLLNKMVSDLGPHPLNDPLKEISGNISRAKRIEARSQSQREMDECRARCDRMQQRFDDPLDETIDKGLEEVLESLEEKIGTEALEDPICGKIHGLEQAPIVVNATVASRHCFSEETLQQIAAGLRMDITKNQSTILGQPAPDSEICDVRVTERGVEVTQTIPPRFSTQIMEKTISMGSFSMGCTVDEMKCSLCGAEKKTKDTDES